MEAEKTILVRCKIEKIKMKDFNVEVRAKMDISCLLDDAYISLNENDSDIDSILQDCLYSVSCRLRNNYRNIFDFTILQMSVKEKCPESLIREATEVVWCDKNSKLYRMTL